ncbi:MAG: carboxypeptidase M32 [Nitrospirales bacterium]|nr:carboxypeptidase M32 [Nitrospira sp.]MDR4500324.1 carboxypeptidase M32 [Nitrospirales bacterium]
MIADPSFTKLTEKLTTIHHIKDACAVLSWDQETYMPTGSGQARAEQIATLQTLAHESFVSSEMEQLLGKWIDIDTGEPTFELDDESRALLHETWRDFHRAKKLPSKFVNTLERECSLAQQVWAEARKKNDFASFLPNLRRVIALKLEETEYLGYANTPYDALLDEYEPGSTVHKLQPLFSTLRPRLISLLQRVLNSSVKPNNSLLTQTFDQAKQLAFGENVLKRMGYEFNRGRLDQSAHPFTTAFHPHDVRVTTRVFEQDFQSCLFSCIHEGGHGLYEQGLRPEHYGTVLGEAVSLGIHESQSRLWENCVGRSLPFWQHFFPEAQKIFPDQLGHASLDEFYVAVNQAKPSLIRVEADELTYNLHIMVRFEIELALIERQIQAEDLPAIWNEKMQEYLGITPNSDAQGVLQDVHWSFGAFGYFPTYTLGNLYASMFYAQVKEELPTLEAGIAAGHMLPLKDWLNQKIHRWGRQFPPDVLVSRVTGHAPSPEPFLTYLEQKFSQLYNFSLE